MASTAWPEKGASMTSLQRVQSVLEGRLPDRPPFSFWYHFQPQQVSGVAGVQAHLDQLAMFQMDFLKVMNDNPYPHRHAIQRVSDLAGLLPLRGDEAGFGQQLEMVAELRQKLGGRIYMATTIFNAWMVLRLLVEPPKHHLPPDLDASADSPSRWIREAYATSPEAVTSALRAIGTSLARFAAKCRQAGADGIFLSVRDDWVDLAGRATEGPNLYQTLVRPTDLEILSAVSDAPFNILHVCGQTTNLRPFGEYPVRVINWADRAAGPSIESVRQWMQPAICGGVDNLGTLRHGSADDVRQEVADTLHQAGTRPIIIAPGCTFDPDRVPRANLEALARTAREWQYTKQ